jgi:predicted small metal-binding protein
VRVIDCECGETLQAANDDDLRKVVAAHMEQAHSMEGQSRLSDDKLAELVAARAYDATDS